MRPCVTGRATHRRDDGARPLDVERRRPERDEPVLAARHQGAVGGVEQTQHRLAVRHRARARRQVEGDVARACLRVVALRVLQLHVGAELVPRDGAVRRPVDLLEERVDLAELRGGGKERNVRNGEREGRGGIWPSCTEDEDVSR